MNAGFERPTFRHDEPAELGDADADMAKALRHAKEACELIERAAPMSGARGHSIRIAQAISESLVVELEAITGKSARSKILRTPPRS